MLCNHQTLCIIKLVKLYCAHKGISVIRPWCNVAYHHISYMDDAHTMSMFLQSAIRRLFPVNACVETGLLRYYPFNLYPVNSPTFSWRLSV